MVYPYWTDWPWPENLAWISNDLSWWMGFAGLLCVAALVGTMLHALQHGSSRPQPPKGHSSDRRFRDAA